MGEYQEGKTNIGNLRQGEIRKLVRVQGTIFDSILPPLFLLLVNFDEFPE
jgi:hypothetical protein